MARSRCVLTLTIALSVVIVVPTLDADHSNIVFIMSDDHAAHAIGAYGSRVNQTSNIDRRETNVPVMVDFGGNTLPLSLEDLRVFLLKEELQH